MFSWQSPLPYSLFYSSDLDCRHFLGRAWSTSTKQNPEVREDEPYSVICIEMKYNFWNFGFPVKKENFFSFISSFLYVSKYLAAIIFHQYWYYCTSRYPLMIIIRFQLILYVLYWGAIRVLLFSTGIYTSFGLRCNVCWLAFPGPDNVKVRETGF